MTWFQGILDEIRDFKYKVTENYNLKTVLDLNYDLMVKIRSKINSMRANTKNEHPIHHKLRKYFYVNNTNYMKLLDSAEKRLKNRFDDIKNEVVYTASFDSEDK